MKKHFLICFTLLVCLFSHNSGFGQLTLLNSPAPTSSGSGGAWSDGYTITPSVNISVTAFRTYFGVQATLWNSSGTVLATQAIASPGGSWTTQSALATPVVLTAGQTYTLGIYSSSGVVWYYDAPGPSTFSNGALGPGMEISGNNRPTSIDNTGWLIDLVYSTCSTITPGTIGSAQTICYNTTPSAFTSLTLPTGGDGTGNYTYQWQSSPDNTTWTNIGGATSTTYAPGALTSTTYFQRTETSGTCGTVNSNSIQVTVYPNLVAGSIGTAQTICYNSTPAGLTSTTLPTGGAGTYTYQWQSSLNNSTWTNIGGATSTTYSPGALTSNTYYRRAETSGTCGTVYTTSVLITVYPNLIHGTIGTAQSICYNTTPATLTNVASPTGGTGSYTYQWQSSPDNATWSDIGGATSATYSPGALITSTYYRRVETSGTCGTVNTPSILVTVYPNLTAGTIGSTQAICYNTVPAQLTNVASPTGGTGSYTYQWQNSPDGFTWNNIGGATSATFAPGPLTSTTGFRRQETSGSCGTVTSNAITVTVGAPLVAGSIGASQTICYNTVPAPELNITLPTGGVVPFTYQWQSSTDDATWANIPGATSTGYSSGALTTTTYYRRAETTGTCGTVYSNELVTAVFPNLVAGSVGTSQTICYNTVPAPFTSNTLPTGGNGNYTYQWESSTDGINYRIIQGATNPTYSSGALTTTTYFQRAETSGACGTVYTNIITITVYGNLVAGTIGTSQSICYNTVPASLTNIASPTGGTGSYTYQWQSSPDNITWTNILGATSATFSPASLTSTTSYRRMETSGTCGTVISNAVTITVGGNLVAGSVGTSQSICYSTAPTAFSSNTLPTGGLVAFTYQWQSSSDNITWNDISGATSTTYTTGNLTSTTYYRRAETSGTCGTVYSNIITVTVGPPTIITNQPAATPSAICVWGSSNITISVTGGFPTLSYQWQYFNGVTWANVANGTPANAVYLNPTSNNLSVSGINNAGSYNYRCQIWDGCITTTSNTTSLTVNPTLVPSVSITPNPSGPICVGTPVTFTANPTNGGTTPGYTFKLNGTPVQSGPSASYTNTSLGNNDVVTCIITSNAVCASPTTATSNSITMSVLPILSPSVTISANPPGVICAQTNVTFAASPVNGGTGPLYQWQKNGNTVGNASDTYNDNTLANGDIITAVLTSNYQCINPSTAISNSIAMTVNPLVQPLVSISPSPSATICAQTNVTFTATPTYGGITPTYQWVKNGNNVGLNSNTYSDNGLVTGDEIQVYLESSEVCANPSVTSSNVVTMTVNPLLTPSINITPNPNGAICSNSNVTFTATTNNGGTSPSYQWQKNNANVGTNSSTYSSSGLANNDIITCILTSNATCATPNTASSNGVTMSVNTLLTPSVSIYSNTEGSICAQTNVTFTAIPTNGGGVPAYQWQKNGVAVGTNSNTYTDGGLADGDVITVVLTSNATCASPTTATSNALVMSVNPLLTPTISVSQNPTGAVCAQTSVTFSANATNGGSNPNYEFDVNGVSVQSGSSTVYTNSALNNNDVVTCILTSNATCATAETATSNALTITIKPIVVPTLLVSSGSQGTICAGSNVTFTASPGNGGNFPSYQWIKNGSSVGANSPLYTDNTLVSGDLITCVLTSDAACASPSVVNGNTINVTITQPVTPSITIGSSAEGPICAGTRVTFTVTTTGGGSTPGYQWIRNGLNVGSNSSSYTGNTFNNGDAINCILTSNAACATPSQVSSESITLTVNPLASPSITVNSDQGTTICAGTIVNFNAITNNGGGNPVYQWEKNGNPVGQNITTYADSGLLNSDVITCQLTSDATCATPASVTASNLTFTVNPNVTPTIRVTQSPATLVCAGKTVTFTASPTNGGLTPAYQWYKNGLAVGTSNSQYFDNGLITGDAIACVLTSSAACALPVNDTSSAISMVVTNNITPSVTITSNQTIVCAGQPVTFTGNVSNQGSSPIFQWVIDGHNYTGPNDTIFTTSVLTGQDTVALTLYVDTALGCFTAPFVFSNTVALTVNPLPATPVISQQGDTLVSSATSGNQWYENGVIITGATQQYFVPLHPGHYQVVVTDNHQCSSDTSFGYNFVTTGIQNINQPNIEMYPNPANNLLYIQSGQAIITTIQVIDILGQTIATKEVNQTNYQLDVSRMVSGNYILILQTTEGTIKKLFNVDRN